MADNVLIGFPRRKSSFTLSSGSWEADYPLTNAFNDEYARVIRSTDATEASTLIVGTSSVGVPLRMFGLAAHNGSLSGTYNLKLYDDVNSPTELLAEKTGKLIPAAYTYEGRIWETNNFWTGQYTEAELSGQIRFTPIIFDQNYIASRFELQITDTTNSDGYFQMGLLEVASGWSLTVNPQMPAQYGYRFLTRTREIDGGLKRHETFPPSYVFSGEIPHMDREEVQNNAMELFRQHGVHLPFMWMPHEDNKEVWLRNSKMVNLVNPGLFSYITEGFDSVPLNLEEYKG